MQDFPDVPSSTPFPGARDGHTSPRANGLLLLAAATAVGPGETDGEVATEPRLGGTHPEAPAVHLL